MTVKEVYAPEIDVEEVSSLAEESDYWETCDKFLSDVWMDNVSSMSKKQLDWLDRIAEGLLREASRN